MRFALIFILFLGFKSVSAQSAMEQVLQLTNRQKLRELADLYKKKSDFKLRKAYQFALERNLPITIDLKDGGRASLIELDTFGLPKYAQTYNHSAAISTNTHLVLDSAMLGYRLDGQNLIIGEWDAGGILMSHRELTGRIIQIDQPDTTHDHAQHVAGTMIASGINPLATGMAPKAQLWAHDWFDDESEMATAAANGLLISQHSYGWITGWYQNPDLGTYWYGNQFIDNFEDANFGRYDEHAKHWDEIAFNAPYYLICKSAGNDRGDFNTGSHYVRDSSGTWVSSSDVRDKDGGNDGYDCIGHNGNAKNILTIGAVEDVPSYQSADDVKMTTFSSWGPSDDGRIKPDLVGNGYNVYSTSHRNDSSYSVKSGTSMSGPNVAGSLLLAQEAYQKYRGHYMRAASLKGLAIHTCREAGLHDGPDYRYGWGILDTWAAVQMITNPKARIEELDIISGDTVYYRFYNDGQQSIKATIAWTDVPDSNITFSLNDRTPKLVHDLDLQIIDPKGNVHLPYCLDPENPDQPAFRATNQLDNVEQVPIDFTSSGTYTVMVSHKGQIDGKQAFSLIIDGVHVYPDLCLAQTDVFHPSSDSSISEIMHTATKGDTIFTVGRYKGYLDIDTLSTAYSTVWQYFISGATGGSLLFHAPINCDTTIQFCDLQNNGQALYLAGTLHGQCQIGSQSVNSNGMSNGFIAKVQFDGSCPWLQLHQSSFSTVESIKTDQNGLHLGGHYRSSIQIGTFSQNANTTSDDIYVAYLDSQGQITSLNAINSPNDLEIIDLETIENSLFIAINTSDSITISNQTIYSDDHSILLQFDELFNLNRYHLLNTDSSSIIGMEQQSHQLLVFASTSGHIDFANHYTESNTSNTNGVFAFSEQLHELWHTSLSSNGTIEWGPSFATDHYLLTHVLVNDDLLINDSLLTHVQNTSYIIGIDQRGQIFHFQTIVKDTESDINSLTVESNSITLGCTISDSIQLDNQSSLFLTEDYAYIQRSLWPEINLSLGPDQFVACLDTIPLQVSIDSSVSQFEWISANPIADSSSLNTYAIINQSGNIIFSAQNGCGQSTSDFILVEVLDSMGMFLDLGPDTIIQCNDSLFMVPNLIGPGPLSFQWSPSHGINNTDIANPMISPQFSNLTYTLQMTNSCGGTISDDIQIDVIKPTLTALDLQDTAITCGDSVLIDLLVSGSTNLSYQWIPSSFVDNPQSVPARLSPITSTNYTLRVLGGCGSVLNRPITIDVDSISVFIQYNNDTLTTNDSYVNYQWIWNGQDIPLQTNDYFTPTDSGYYQLRATDSKGCTGKSNPFYYYPNALNSIKEIEFSVYPNPSFDEITIQTQLPHFQYRIIDILGIECIRGYSNQGQIQINTSHLSSGIYNLVIEYQHKIKSKRIHKLE